MRLKRKIVIGVIVLLVIGAGYYFWSSAKPETVPTEEVKRGNVVETVSVTGELVPVSYADLSFPLAGTLKWIGVTENDRVKKGDVIATLETDVLEAEQRASVAALRIAEESEKLARRDWDGLSPEEREAKKLATEQARENVRVLGARIENALLRAPFDGRVSRVPVRAGEVVGIGTIIARLVESDTMIIEARVPESDIAKVDLGREATVDFDAFSANEKFVAVVSKTAPASTVLQGVVSYVVEFELKNADERLLEGMTANIDIETKKREGVLTLPFRAISKEGGKNYVEVLRPDGILERVEVTTGLEGDDGTVEIIRGVVEGDLVTIGARQQK